MAVYLGSITFRYSTMWIDKERPTILGSDEVVADGGIVTIEPDDVVQGGRRAQIDYEWEPWSTVKTLYDMAETGATFTLKPEEDDASTYQVRFARDNGVETPEHQAFGHSKPKAPWDEGPLDLYKGRLNLIILE
jgi:hypothetical protein